ncbi:putative 60S ribosomal protein L25 [Lojkania enalia]|uniref:60S ribosomal protein L25 n=1 Tax=Lojkania enalia TaxID=147567 RepID=A0A9P4K8B6_9PLEO|nr:putative 60S ribosomal protein L25 [Didymosphaeria enalia]
MDLARSLPPRLLRFFAKYPPPPSTYTPPSPYSAPVAALKARVAPTTSSAGLNAPAIETNMPSLVVEELPYHNPFQPRKNFVTGRWYGPRYGLRQQADLVKLAEKHGVVDLLPYTIKKPGEKEKRRIERGLRVKGTGVDEKVKGKMWERTLKGRLELRKKAMLQMPAMIQEWKRLGHGRGWKKYPKKGGHGVF